MDGIDDSVLETEEESQQRQEAEDRKQEVLRRALTFSKRQTALTGFEDQTSRRLIEAGNYLRKINMPTLRPLLPLLLQLKGKPYRLRDYFPFEPFFRTRMPQTIVLKTGRQVSKSTSLAAQGIMQAVSMPYFSTLFITPLFEQIRRFSGNYVGDFIKNSPVGELYCNAKTSQNVLQRSFINGSNMYFSYAFLDAERVRGLASDCVSADEIQDLNYDFLPIIYETLSGSPWNLKKMSGTPKSMDNTMQAIWTDSSQAEFAVKCQEGGCNHWNVPALDHDLLDMIGPVHDDISEKAPGIVCAKCRKPLDPRRHGRWIHAIPERRHSFAGYHIPQIIMPMHYANRDKWSILVGKMEGQQNTTKTVFFNEVLGESNDEGSKLVTETDLKAAAILPWVNKWQEAVQHISAYRYRVLAVDWGGGGGRIGDPKVKSRTGTERRLRTSYTSLAVLGIHMDGKIDCLWGHRSLRTHDMEWEAKLVVETLAKFRCSHLVHDYGGAGSGREVLVNQAGFPLEKIVAIKYHGAASKNLMVFRPATDDHPRDWYSVDKSRSLMTTCQCIKYGLIRFFKYDRVDANNPGLISDFLALIEEKVDSRLGTDVYCITRNPNRSDDFAQAVNIGCCTLWYMTGDWPNLAESLKMWINPAILQQLHPLVRIDWDDI